MAPAPSAPPSMLDVQKMATITPHPYRRGWRSPPAVARATAAHGVRCIGLAQTVLLSSASRPAASRSCSSAPTRLKPSRRAAERINSDASPPALSVRAIRSAAPISSMDKLAALRVAPVSLERSRTGVSSTCARVNQKMPSVRSAVPRDCAVPSASLDAARILLPAFSFPKQDAKRRATSSTWIGPSSSTIRVTRLARIPIGVSSNSFPTIGKYDRL